MFGGSVNNLTFHQGINEPKNLRTSGTSNSYGAILIKRTLQKSCFNQFQKTNRIEASLIFSSGSLGAKVGQ